MSPAEEAFGPPHTGHQEVVPPDLHAHAPLPPPIPVVPDIPMAGGVPEPAETGCPRHLGGFTLLSPSWQDFIHANPLPEQQTATVVWVEPKPLTPDEVEHIEKIGKTEKFFDDHPDLKDEAQRVRQGETLPQGRNHVDEAEKWLRGLKNSMKHLEKVRRSRNDESQRHIDHALEQARRYMERFRQMGIESR